VRRFCACLVVAAAALPAAGDEPVRANAPLSSAQAKAYQQAWASHLGKSVQVTNSVGMTFQLIPPGRFEMGSPQDEEWHRPDEILHTVTITKAFYMATTEVTQGQWKALMNETPSFSPAIISVPYGAKLRSDQTTAPSLSLQHISRPPALSLTQ